jgi:hypothetical protein
VSTLVYIYATMHKYLESTSTNFPEQHFWGTDQAQTHNPELCADIGQVHLMLI